MRKKCYNCNTYFDFEKSDIVIIERSDKKEKVTDRQVEKKTHFIKATEYIGLETVTVTNYNVRDKFVACQACEELIFICEVERIPTGEHVKDRTVSEVDMFGSNSPDSIGEEKAINLWTRKRWYE